MLVRSAYAGEQIPRTPSFYAAERRGIKPPEIKSLFKHFTASMRDAGLIRESYSLHDLRHYFATTEYGKNKDIYALSHKLNHSGIAVTGAYLTTLKRDFD